MLDEVKSEYISTPACKENRPSREIYYYMLLNEHILLKSAADHRLLSDEPSGHIPQGLLDRARPICEPLRCGIMGKPSV